MPARQLLYGPESVRLSRRQWLAGALTWRGLVRPQPLTVAFHYAAIFPPDAVAWYGRFSILVTGGILASSQTAALKARGAKLLGYEWSSAFYPDDPVSAAPEWQRAALANRRQWLLNQTPIGGGAAAPGKQAYWYDFGAGELIAARAAHLAELLERSGYDGLFLDTLGFSQLPAEMREEFRRRHPEVDYERQQGKFLRQLRRYLGPGKLLFLNQGYRNADAYLPYADFDLTESYMTYIREDNQTVFRPWRSQTDPWQSISVPIERLVLPAARNYPAVRFVHLNYAAGSRGTIARALRYSFAAACLFGHLAYLVAPDRPEAERDEIYFSELGAPLGDYCEDPSRSVAWRVFERGVVAINWGPGQAEIPELGLKLPDPPRGYVLLS